MSISAQQQKDGNRKLKQWLENDKKVVTYRDISREIACHVNHAKNLLLSYHSSHEATATYILTGPLLRESTLTYTQLPPQTQAEPKATQSLAHMGGQVKIVDMDQMSDGEANSEADEDDDDVRMGNDEGADDAGALGVKGAEDDHEGELEAEETPRWGVVLVSEEGLEEKKKLFEQDKLSIHIYALSPTPVKDPGQFLVSNLSLRTNKDYSNPAIYGTITGEGFKASTEPMRDGGIDFSSKPAAAKEEEPTKKAKKDDKEVKAPVKEETKTKAKAKGEKESQPKPAKAEPEVAEPSKPSNTKSETKKRRSASPVKAPTKAKKAEAEAPKPSGPSSSQARSEEQAAMEAMMGMDMDQDLGMDDDMDETQDSTADVPVKKEAVERKRKRRTVKKSKMEMDEKGYMVTKDYDTEESYSGESEPETTVKSKPKAAPPKKAPAPAPSRTTSTTSVESDRKPNVSKTASGAMKKGPGGQSTLQGFFKKK